MDIVEYLKGEKKKIEEEVDFWKRKFFVIQSEYGFHKEQLDDYKRKYDALYVQFQEKKLDSYIVEGKLKDLTNGVSTSENDELSKYKATCDKLNKEIEEFKRRCKEWATQAESRQKNQVNLEKQLKDYKTKYNEMYARFTENKEVGVSLENDLNEYKKMCAELNVRVESLEKDNRKAKSVDGELCIDQLNQEITHLRSEKRRADDETNILNSKLGELESQTTLYLKELVDYKVKCHGLSGELKEKEMECHGYEGKLKDLASITDAFQDEREGYKTTLNGLEKKISCLAEDRKILCNREKKAAERISCLQGVIQSLIEDNKKLTNDEGGVQLSRESKMYSSPHVNRDEHASGSLSREKQSEPLVNLNGNREKASPSLFSLALADGGTRMISFESEKRERALLEQDNLEPAGIIQISENEDDMEMMRNHTCDIGGRQKLIVSTDNTIERCSNSTKCLTTLIHQKGDEYGFKCKVVDIPFSSSAPKRKRLSETVTSDSDEDDETTVSEFMAKKLEELKGSPTSKISPVSLCAGDVALSSRGQNVNEFVTTSPQRLLSVIMGEEKKILADGTSEDEYASLNTSEMGSSSQEEVGNLTVANDEEELTEETDSDSGDSKTDDDAMENELDSFEVVAMMRRILG